MMGNMFWNQVAGIYDIFVNVINRKTHKALREQLEGLLSPQDEVLECACGTGMLSSVIAKGCKHLTATDYSPKMLKQAKKNCAGYANVTFALGDISHLDYSDGSFDTVVAGNVIHLLDDPLGALSEMNRVCKDKGTLILPTYMNRDKKGNTSSFAKALGKAGASFKRQFTPESYRQFFLDAGYPDVCLYLAEGRIPCAVAVMKKKQAETNS